MNKKRPRARAPLGWLGLLAWLIIGASAALPAGAQDPRLYQEPGRHPYTGDEATALRLLGAESRRTPHFSAVTDAELTQGLAAYQQSSGCFDYYVQDGDVLVVTYSDNGDYAETVEVAFVDPSTGQPYPKDHPIRQARACGMGRDDGVVLGKLQHCNNWMLATRPPLQLPERRCEPPAIQHRSMPAYTPGVFVRSCCPGCPPLYVRGQFYYPDNPPTVYPGSCDPQPTRSTVNFGDTR